MGKRWFTLSRGTDSISKTLAAWLGWIRWIRSPGNLGSVRFALVPPQRRSDRFIYPQQRQACLSLSALTYVPATPTIAQQIEGGHTGWVFGFAPGRAVTEGLHDPCPRTQRPCPTTFVMSPLCLEWPWRVVRRVLSDATYSANARKVGEKLEARGGAPEAARLIEGLVWADDTSGARPQTRQV